MTTHEANRFFWFSSDQHGGPYPYAATALIAAREAGFSGPVTIARLLGHKLLNHEQWQINNMDTTIAAATPVDATTIKDAE